MSQQARPIDGAAGYRFFLDHFGDVELDEINEHLRGLKLRTVQPRMLMHYRKLQRYGYSAYITQNRLDLAVAGEAAWSDDMRAQYAEVSQAVDGEILFGEGWHPVVVDSLGLASASVVGSTVPPAGGSVVLRLVKSGIERTATVSRRDPAAGRADLVFDTLSSLPIASRDAPTRLTITLEMSAESESLVAISDILIRLDRLISRVASKEELPRILSVTKGSPLQIVMAGAPALAAVGVFIERSAAARKSWYEGTKAKYEAKGIRIDSEQKRRKVQQEADSELLAEIETQEPTPEPPILTQFETEHLRVGLPGSMSRRQFIEACRAAFNIPVQASAVVDRSR